MKLTVDVEHHNSVSSCWYDIWAGAVAVTAVCVMKGHGGTSGLPGGLTVTLDVTRDPKLEGNETAVS